MGGLRRGCRRVRHQGQPATAARLGRPVPPTGRCAGRACTPSWCRTASTSADHRPAGRGRVRPGAEGGASRSPSSCCTGSPGPVAEAAAMPDADRPRQHHRGAGRLDLERLGAAVGGRGGREERCRWRSSTPSTGSRRARPPGTGRHRDRCRRRTTPSWRTPWRSCTGGRRAPGARPWPCTDTPRACWSRRRRPPRRRAGRRVAPRREPGLRRVGVTPGGNPRAVPGGRGAPARERGRRRRGRGRARAGRLGGLDARDRVRVRHGVAPGSRPDRRARLVARVPRRCPGPLPLGGRLVGGGGGPRADDGRGAGGVE